MARRRRTAPAHGARAGFMAPVEMPPQTYQWNKRAVDESAGGTVTVAEPYADPAYVAQYHHAPVAPAGPTGVAPVAPAHVVDPVAPAHVEPAQPFTHAEPAQPVAQPVAHAGRAQPAGSAPAGPAQPAGSAPAWGTPLPAATPDRGAYVDTRPVWGIGAACVVALGLPAGAFALMHAVSVPGIGGTNWGLVIGVAALAFTVAGIVGYLVSDRRFVGGPVRAAIAAGLSIASSALVMELIATHPRKFGFELTTPMTLLAILPAAMAAFVAFRPIAADL